MLINAGRVLMFAIWAVLLLNLVPPASKPLIYFIDVALIFMIVTHGIELVLFKATQPAGARFQQLKLILFGVFELLAWQKKYYLYP